MKEFHNPDERTYTLEEFDAMLYRNEHFQGTRADLSKIKRYETMRSYLLDVLRQCSFPLKLEEAPPSPNKMHAMLSLDMKDPSSLDSGDIALIGKVMELSDRMSFTSVKDRKNPRLRLNFAVENVWSD